MHRSIKEHPAYNDLIRQIKANDTRLRTPTRHGPSPRYDEWYQLLKHKQDLLYMQLESGMNWTFVTNMIPTSHACQPAIPTEANGLTQVVALIRL